MKTLSKKLFSLLLVLIMLVSIVPFAAFATGEEGGGEGGGEGGAKHEHATEYKYDANNHWIECGTEDDPCPEADAKGHYMDAKHGSDGKWYPGEGETDAEGNSIESTKHVKKCKVCGLAFVSEDHGTPETKPALWVAGEITKEASADEEGEQIYNCKTCGAAVKVTLPKVTVQKCTIHINVHHGTDKITPLQDQEFESPVESLVIHPALLDSLGFDAKKLADDYVVTQVYKFDVNSDALPNNTLTNFTGKSCTLEVFIEYTGTAKVKLDANGGKIDSKHEEVTINAATNEPMANLPTSSRMSRAGFTFVGWFTDPFGGDRVYNDTRYKDWETLYAHWTQDTVKLTIKLVKGDNIYGAQKLDPLGGGKDILVPKGTNLLKYLQDNFDEFALESVPAGYYWNGTGTNSTYGYWYDHTGKDILSSQRQMNSDTTVHIKCNPIEYTVTFEPRDGKITSGKDTVKVKFQDAVGTLPVATRDGYVFQGWFDDEDIKWTSSTKLTVPDNVVLHAKWAEQAKVYLRVYLNGSTSNPVILAMDDHISGQNVTQKDAEKLILQYYSAQDGKKLELVGLFTKATWNDYVAGKLSKGDATYTIPNLNDETTLYVMVNNAKQGPTTTTSSGTTKPSGIPKTGDTAMIYTAATVMVLAAAALVTTQIIRKKKNG